jgi:hypothetical protein
MSNLRYEQRARRNEQRAAIKAAVANANAITEPVRNQAQGSHKLAGLDADASYHRRTWPRAKDVPERQLRPDSHGRRSKQPDAEL